MPVGLSSVLVYPENRVLTMACIQLDGNLKITARLELLAALTGLTQSRCTIHVRSTHLMYSTDALAKVQ